MKSGIDIACWDILGKATNLPVCTLLGGRSGESVRLYRAISKQAPEEMAKNVQGYREQGYTRFQLKVGGDPDTDIERIRAVRAMLQRTDRLVADANTGWTQHEATRAVPIAVTRGRSSSCWRHLSSANRSWASRTKKRRGRPAHKSPAH